MKILKIDFYDVITNKLYYMKKLEKILTGLNLMLNDALCNGSMSTSMGCTEKGFPLLPLMKRKHKGKITKCFQVFLH